MNKNLESNYDCAQSGDDLHELLQQLNSLQADESGDPSKQQERNRIENQIAFIKNKCDIRP